MTNYKHRGVFVGDLNSTTILPGYYSFGAVKETSTLVSNLPSIYSTSKPCGYNLFIQFIPYKTQLIFNCTYHSIAFRRYSGSPANWTSYSIIEGVAG